MSRIFVKSKIHNAVVTRTDLEYEGSISLDPGLMAAADIEPFEQVHVLNLNNGNRLETYVIRGKAGSGEVCLNGAAARLAEKGDRVIILTYAHFAQTPPAGYGPRVVTVGPKNRILKTKGGQ
jgi:aspartate 1-decarboxylase